MASPQLENGHVKIATELFEALCLLRIPGEARQVFDFILRKTYGFNKKTDCIALSQFVIGTGLKKQTVIRALSKLKQMNLITQKDNDIANEYVIVKDYSKWVPLPKKITLSKKITSVTQKDNNRNPKRYIQKTITKDTITKDITSGVEDNAGDHALIVEVFKAFETVDPKNKTLYGNKTQRKACEFLLKEYGLDRVKRAIELLPEINTRNLYIGQITTPYELQQNWVKLGNALRKNQVITQPKWKVWN